MDPQGPSPVPTGTAQAAAEVAAPLRDRAVELGRHLGRALHDLHQELLPAGAGPKKAADLLGQPVPMASRVLAALGESDPLALLHRLPGPEPMRRWARAFGRKGAAQPAVQRTLEALDAFEGLIADEGGDRSALDAQLVAYLPAARRALELRRRQAVFRGLSELEGIACRLELSTLVIHPNPDGTTADLLCIQARTGLAALRPGLRTKFVTERVAGEFAESRHPQNLDGSDPLLQPGGARLDAYCVAPPAPLEVVQLADRVQYVLGTHGHGANAEVDCVIAELNPREFKLVEGPKASSPFFSHLVQTPTRAAVLDVVLHPSLVPSSQPQLHLHRNIGERQATPRDPAREVDRLEAHESVQHWVGAARDLRLPGLPRYGELCSDVFTRLGWETDELHLFRVELVYPVPGTQASVVLDRARF